MCSLTLLVVFYFGSVSLTAYSTKIKLPGNASVFQYFIERNEKCIFHLGEVDHEIISTVILLPSADSFKKG